MKLNYKDPIYLLVILTVSFFLWGTCQKNKVLELKAESQDSQYRERVEQLDRQAKSAAARADSLRAGLVLRRTSDSLTLMGLKMRNSTMSKKLAEQRQEIQPFIDSLQPVRDYVILADSLLAAKDTIISHLTLSHEADIVDLEAIIKAREDQILVEATKGHLWEEVAVKTEKDYNKERRRKSFWRTTASILAGGVLFLTLQN